jgi:guanylate kinase
MTTTSPQKGTLYTVAAPSGAGKTSLVKALVERLDNLFVSVSHTTRVQRDGEQNAVAYHFVDKPVFDAMREQGDFLEHAEVFAHQYGTSRNWVEQQLQQGKHVILEIDWQGVRQIKQKFPDCVRVFILPPSIEVLQQRLHGRGQDSAEIIAARMQAARNEIAHHAEADYLIVNDDFEATLADLSTLITHQTLPSAQAREVNEVLAASLLVTE